MAKIAQRHRLTRLTNNGEPSIGMFLITTNDVKVGEFVHRVNSQEESGQIGHTTPITSIIVTKGTVIATTESGSEYLVEAVE
jgi:hypothetical protein